jgi:putative ABC transport system substrate-binding protein
MNNRRKLVIALGTAAAIPPAVFGQSRQPPVLIGWLNTDSRELSEKNLNAFKQALAALGWKEGTQYAIEERWAGGRIDRLPFLAKDLAARKPEIIVAAYPAAVRAAALAAPNTPVVMTWGSDPVKLGFAKSLARPGGMITGVTDLGGAIAEKHLEFLIAAAPTVKRVGVLVDLNLPAHPVWREAVKRSVAQYKVDARFTEIARPQEIEPAISSMVRNERRRIVKRALAERWPVVAGVGDWAEAGALLSYTADDLAGYRRSAQYVDRILKGAKAGDLPFEQPMTFELVVNLNTAKTLGLTIPPEIMVRATRVIQ